MNRLKAIPLELKVANDYVSNSFLASFRHCSITTPRFFYYTIIPETGAYWKFFDKLRYAKYLSEVSE